MNLFLIGYRCTGKTCAAGILAKKLGWERVDTDEEIVCAAGKNIQQIVAEDGWEAFRRLEAEMIARACLRQNQVVATGGGAVLDPANVIHMKNSGQVICLTASPEIIYERMTRDARTASLRPALSSGSESLFAEIKATLAERQNHYRNAMDFSVATDTIDIETVCRRILALLDPLIRQKLGNL